MIQKELYNVLLRHSRKYPLMTLKDYYKLIHQAVFGPKHFMSNPSKEQLLNYLNKELNEIRDQYEHELIEYIGHGFYRVDLYAISVNRISKDSLIDGFYKTMLLDLGKQEKRSRLMETSLETLKSFLIDKLDQTRLNEFDELIGELKLKSYPAVHHSDIYVSRYHPHYRVIHKTCLNLDDLKE